MVKNGFGDLLRSLGGSLVPIYGPKRFPRVYQKVTKKFFFSPKKAFFENFENIFPKKWYFLNNFRKILEGCTNC